MRLVVFTVLTIALAAACAWFSALGTCSNLLSGARAFDFFCGHNVLLQVIPLFVLFTVLFTVLSRVLARRWGGSGKAAGHE